MMLVTIEVSEKLMRIIQTGSVLQIDIEARVAVCEVLSTNFSNRAVDLEIRTWVILVLNLCTVSIALLL